MIVHNDCLDPVLNSLRDILGPVRKMTLPSLYILPQKLQRQAQEEAYGMSSSVCQTGLTPPFY